MLSQAQYQRFSRQVLLYEVGTDGQERLLAATVGIARLDEGGRAAALWLARAGVGRLDLPEDGSPAPSVDPSGLLHATDAGLPMKEAVRSRLVQHAPHIAFDGHATRFAVNPSGVEDGIRSALAAVRELLSSGSRAPESST